VLTLINGIQRDTVPVQDRGLQYGDGLFETIAVRQGRPRLLERHLQRLQSGCERLQLPMPDAEMLAREIAQSFEGSAEAVVKVVLTRGSGNRGYRFDSALIPTRIVSAYPWPDHPKLNHTQGVSLRWCSTTLARQPSLAGLKHLNRLEQVLARAEWGSDYTDGLMCDNEGHVIECTMSNLFLVEKNVLLTPDLSQCGIEGVMRGEVLERARQMDMLVSAETILPARLSNADEIFITNAVIGIWPVSSVEKRKYAVGKVTQALQAALSDFN